ncbi:MAG: ComF family protein [Lysobacteraceae bacterium]|nr:MAG: ComF family protein [Xanthomonadaceae bacterium]
MPDPVNREASSPVDGWRWPGLPWRPRCLGCGAPGEGREDLCGACRARLPWLAGEAIRCAPPLRQAVAVFAYAPPVDRWLPRFKFHRDLAAGRLLSELMLARLAACDRPAALLPIPLHGARLRARGYDQALELARPLARALALPLRTDLLQRVRATAPQSELDAAARERNLRGAFEARGGIRLPTHVALLDDVLTTGATLHAAAEALHRAGVERIDAWVCARVL